MGGIMEPHPYRRAFEAHDHERVVSLLADDAIFHSPLIGEPGFEGRASAAAILAIALDVFSDIEYTHELGDEHVRLLVGDAPVLGVPVKTTWLLELGEEQSIREIWLMVRPLTGLVALAQAVGRAAERAGLDSAVRELSEPLARLAADLERAAAGTVRRINHATATGAADA